MFSIKKLLDSVRSRVIFSVSTIFFARSSFYINKTCTAVRIKHLNNYSFIHIFCCAKCSDRGDRVINSHLADSSYIRKWTRSSQLTFNISCVFLHYNLENRQPVINSLDGLCLLCLMCFRSQHLILRVSVFLYLFNITNIPFIRVQ